MSKDNVIFAVRPLDAKGHRSLAVVPAAGTVTLINVEPTEIRQS